MQQIADWLASGAGQRQRPAKVPDEELVAIGGVVLRTPLSPHVTLPRRWKSGYAGPSRLSPTPLP
jgi:hypothetical protein